MEKEKNFEKLEIDEIKAIKTHIRENAGYSCYSSSGKMLGHSFPEISINVLLELSELVSKMDYIKDNNLMDNPNQKTAISCSEDYDLLQYKCFQILKTNGVSENDILDILNEHAENE